MPNRSKPATRLRGVACGAVLCCLFAAPAAFAQNYFVVPWLRVETFYDDNIFFNIEEGEQFSDVVLRVSPRLDVGYESETLDWLLSYRNDAEWYRDFSFLDSSTARGFGTGAINYRPNRRLSMNANVDYVTTNAAEDISLIPGEEVPGPLGRADAKRFGAGGGLDYVFTPTLSGVLNLSWVNDERIGVDEIVNENERHTATAVLRQSVARSRTLLYGYRYRNFDFMRGLGSGPVETINTTARSHTPWVGWSQSVSDVSDLEVRVGARFAEADLVEDEVDPYLLFRWVRSYARGAVRLTASWDETTVLAEVGVVDAKSLQAGWTHKLSEKFDVAASATYARIERPDYEADTGSFSASGNYRLNRYAFLSLRYRYSIQDVERVSARPLRQVERNRVTLSITLTRPRPSAPGGPV